MANRIPRLVVAMDFKDAETSFKFAEKIKGMPVFLKIHWVLFPKIGFDGIFRLANMFNERIFLDFKLHDIPSVVAKGISSLMKIVPFQIINVHVSGGREMLLAAKEARDKTFQNGCVCSNPPLILGVTVLTSISNDNLAEIGSRFDSVDEAVVSFGKLAMDSGIDGVVASVHETPTLRQTCGDDFLILTPGIRPPGADSQDQARVATPLEAKKMGSDFIVVGRPIIESPDPLSVVEQILHELNE